MAAIGARPRIGYRPRRPTPTIGEWTGGQTIAATATESFGSRLVRGLLVGLFRASGWRAQGQLPARDKYVVVGASHTSNWDFVVFVGTIAELGRHVRFVGKHSLFRWPFGGLMRALGGVPVNRDTTRDLVQQVADQFAAHEDFLLIIAAEGTRARVEQWRTGFYRIAQVANVPIVCAGPDYASRCGVIGPTIWPTGDYDADMVPAYAFFRSLHPRHPARAGFPA